MPLRYMSIRWCAPVWFLAIAVLVICLGQHSCHLMAHIGLWTYAQNQGTLQVPLLVFPGDPSSMLHCLPSKQRYTDTLVRCHCPYIEYGQLWSNVLELITTLLLTLWAPVKGFGLASFMDIITCVVGTSYLGLQDGPGASSCYISGIFGVSHCIRAVSCICTHLGAIFAM